MAEKWSVAWRLEQLRKLRPTGPAAWNLVWRYAWAMAVVVLATLVRWALDGVLVDTPYLIYYPAIVAVAAFAGLGPGVLATLASGLLVDIYFVAPSGSLSILEPGEGVRLAVFLSCGLGISLVADIQRKLKIHAQQQAEALADSRRWFAGTIDSAMDAIINVDEAQLIVLFNPAAERMFDCPLAHAVGTSIDRFIPQGFPPAYHEHALDFTSPGRTSRPAGHVGSIMGRRSNGQEFPMEASISQVVVAGKKLLSVILRDGTERQQSEGAQAQLAAIVESSDDAIISKGLDGIILSWNAAAERLFGYHAQEIIGRSITLLLPPERLHEEAEILARLRRGERCEHLETVRVAKNGTRIDVSIRISPVKDRTGQVIGASKIVHDITARKHAIQELQAAKASAEHANKIKDKFLAILSHELRNPLTPVLVTSAMLSKDQRFDTETHDALDMIHRNAELEARLIDDLLDVTRIAQGKVELHRQPLVLGTILQHAIEVCQPDLKARRIHFDLHLPTKPYIVDADATRLQQVFWNLLKNAVKFTPAGGSINVRVQPAPEPAHVIVEVQDTGVGFDDEALARIFQPFEQAERGITRQFGGLGLGLAISKVLVELHGGTISAHSAGKCMGATFIVRLPLTTATTKSPHLGPTNAPPTPTPLTPRHALRVLLVEDHEDTARVMSRLLRAHGYLVAMAGDVATALNLARTQTFDLLLSDLGLPDGSGLDLIRTLRADGSDLPAIALSGYGMQQDIDDSRAAGFAAHLTKPVRLPELYQIINSTTDAANPTRRAAATPDPKSPPSHCPRTPAKTPP